MVKNKKELLTVGELEDFPFDSEMLACRNKGVFPDLAIRLNTDNSLFTGGELIELKDKKTYSVASFNSTIPTGQKGIEKIIKTVNSSIKKQMEDAGNHIFSLPYREVYYLIRGKKKNNSKTVLVHGSFFETVKSDELISQSFEQVLEESLTKCNLQLDAQTKSVLVDMFSKQESFSKVRNIETSSVTLRFRIMTEIKPEGNILNSKQYPEIKDNTVNLIVPFKTETDKELNNHRFLNVFTQEETKQFSIFSLKHHLDGYFSVFQIPIIENIPQDVTSRKPII